MTREVTDFFGILPDFDLALMRKNQSLSDLTERILSGMTPVLQATAPDMVVVHGDTTSAFSAALAAFYRGIPVAHVEAGLRTHDISRPFPEEWNRCAVDTLSSLFFAPTATAAHNLLREGVRQERIHVTGNTVVDALRLSLKKEAALPYPSGGGRLLLLTAHRRESIGAPLFSVFRAVRRLLEVFPDVEVLYPLHPNPRVQEIAHAVLDGCPRIHMTESLPMHIFHYALSKSYLVLTDSGGVQEETTALGIPTLVLREETERPEGVQAGILCPIGTSEDAVFDQAAYLLRDPTAYAALCGSKDVYGDGHACERIAEILEKL